VGGVLNRAANGPAATREMIVTQKREKKKKRKVFCNISGWVLGAGVLGSSLLREGKWRSFFHPSRPLYLIYLILIYCWIVVVEEEEETSSK
jgi:hypothetical protein